jgi:tight adherence protein C
MNGSQWLFLLLVFVVVCALALLAMAIFSEGSIRTRLAGFMDKAEAREDQPGGWIERVAKVAHPFSKLSVPEEGWENSALRTRFMNAGWRNRSSPAVFFAAKTILTLSIPAVIGMAGFSLSWKLGSGFLLLLLAGAALGYYLPNVVLRHLAARRQREIFETIPDALDLLTVCVEAGLSLDQALSKVASEIHIKSVTLAQELQLVLMEMRAGFTKEKALRNFALRSGVDDVDTLVTMLIQSERFGTSMGDSLRVHSDNSRTRRRMAAEEMAAKIALKMLFPLIFLIFPTLMMVLLGPAVIQIRKVLMPALTGTN